MKYNVRFLRDCFFRLAERREVGGDEVYLAGKAGRSLWRYYVDQGEAVDRLVIKVFVFDEPRGEFSADHSRTAGDQDMHIKAPFRRPRDEAAQ
jgi:hypothetical protein